MLLPCLLVGLLSSSNVWVAAEASRSLVTTVELPVQSNHKHLVGLVEGRRGVQILQAPESNAQLVEEISASSEDKSVTHIKASILTAALAGLLVRNIVMSPERRHWGGVFFVGILYLLEAYFCSTRRYLSNILEPTEVLDFVADLQKTAPKVRWDVECYHYEDHYSSRRRHHESSTKRVTHRASQHFWFQQWRDVTRTEQLQKYLEWDPDRKETYVKLSILKLLLFADPEHYQNYVSQQAAFILREGNRDYYTDTSTFIEVEGYLPKLLAVRTVLGTVIPAQIHFYWFFTLLGLTVPYRIWFSRHCDEMNVILTKEVTT